MLNKRNLQFEKIADEYDHSLPSHVVEHYIEKRKRFLLTQSHQGMTRALDVGAGTGRLAERLEAQGWQVTGIDLAYAMLQVMRGREGMAVQGNSGCLPFPDETFDVVYCIAMLHHVAEPDAVRATVREMSRVTRRGGVTIYWDHNPYNPYWPIIMARVPQDTGQERLIPATEIMMALSDLPVSVIAYQTGFIPDFIPPSLLSLFQKLEWLIEHIPGVRRILCAHNVIVARRNA
ncbi:MAG TPA: class I SAM-dependent methyltransferase [Anaerolineae bacterium]|nr:class I SAM-dependent methyltransferase [Anaerolineae bacterium]HQH37891.1 class I SAM-dependent methyltransferase [Anaerolineae bacterium]